VFSDIERTAHKKATIYVTPCRRSLGEAEENQGPSAWGQEFRRRLETVTLPIQIKLKLSLYRPRQAPRFPGD
jgi:hypothetical protein